VGTRQEEALQTEAEDVQEKEDLREHIIGEKGAKDLGVREREEI